MRVAEPEQMIAAALVANGFVAFHQKSSNGIFEAVKVKEVDTESNAITFDRSALEMPDVSIPVDDLHYLDV